MDKDKPNNGTASEHYEKRGFFGVLQSVFAAMFGVQSDKNRERDFAAGYVSEYIFVGIIMTIVFVVSIIWYVNSVIDSYNGT
jgi:hypothetical protein